MLCAAYNDMSVKYMGYAQTFSINVSLVVMNLWLFGLQRSPEVHVYQQVSGVDMWSDRYVGYHPGVSCW